MPVLGDIYIIHIQVNLSSNLWFQSLWAVAVYLGVIFAIVMRPPAAPFKRHGSEKNALPGPIVATGSFVLAPMQARHQASLRNGQSDGKSS